MSFKVIKEKLKTKLQGIGDIQQVEDYPTEDFSGYPAVSVRTDGNSSQYETTNENQELYVFTLFAFYPIDNETNSKVKTREIIEELCDTIRDNIDSDEFLSGISMPSGRVLLGALPTVSKIYEADAGKFITAEIEVAVKVSKTV